MARLLFNKDKKKARMMEWNQLSLIDGMKFSRGRWAPPHNPQQRQARPTSLFFCCGLLAPLGFIPFISVKFVCFGLSSLCGAMAAAAALNPPKDSKTKLHFHSIHYAACSAKQRQAHATALLFFLSGPNPIRKKREERAKREL